jgi:DNA topoisomerase-1
LTARRLEYSIGRKIAKIRDRRIAKVIRACQELPGQELFQYVDDGGEIQDLKSTDVNEYLGQITGADFTAKDFRTWAGTILAAMAFQEFREFDSHAAAKRNITRAIESVAARLGNTPAICRKCYVHPDIVAGYLDGTLARALSRRADRLSSDLGHLRPEEAAVLALLQRRLAAEKRSIKSKTFSRRALV